MTDKEVGKEETLTEQRTTGARRKMDAEILKIANEARNEAHNAVKACINMESKLQNHEEICNMRYERFNEAIKSLSDNINRMINRSWSIAGTIIVLLLGAIGTMVGIIVNHLGQMS